MITLLLLLVQPVPPLLEKDPWAGFKVDSSVKIKRGNDEYTLTLKLDEEKSRYFERDPADEDYDGTYAFVGYLSAFRADGSGYKKSGKSNATVVVGSKTVKTLIETFQAGDADEYQNADIYKITSTDGVPGGILRVERDFTAEGSREKWLYEFKQIEKLKIGDREIEAHRFDYTVTERKKKSTTSYWLSADVPGFLVKISSDGKATFEVREFHVGK